LGAALRLGGELGLALLLDSLAVLSFDGQPLLLAQLLGAGQVPAPLGLGGLVGQAALFGQLPAGGLVGGPLLPGEAGGVGLGLRLARLGVQVGPVVVGPVVQARPNRREAPTRALDLRRGGDDRGRAGGIGGALAALLVPAREARVLAADAVVVN